MSVEERDNVKNSLLLFRDCVVKIYETSGLASKSIHKTIENFPVSCMRERVALYSSITDVSSDNELINNVLMYRTGVLKEV